MILSACSLLGVFLAFVCRGFSAGGAQRTAGTRPRTRRYRSNRREKIRAHVKFLSSDLLEGRGTGQRGGDIAAEYIATQFALYGLKPAGDDGTYFQNVPMVGVKTLPETSFKLAPANGDTVTLKNLDEFVTNNESQTETADIDAPIVFVGYGIKAPEYNWDDYKGYDLNGKVALLFVNEPISDDPKFFKGKALTYYGRWTYKFEETARRGAVATLIIHRTDLASYGWEVVRNSWGSERSYLKRDGTPKLQAASWIQLEVAKKLVAMAGLDLDKLFEQAQSRDFKPMELPVHLKAHVASQLRPFVSRNVLAKLPGADPKRKDEAVLYTAHYDHLGIDPSMKGDNIYNGAVDNATGCGILLEMARAWSLGEAAPPRSILFAAVTAEEQGLARLGISGQAFAGAAGEDLAGSELRRAGADWRSGRSGSERRGANDVLSGGGVDGEDVRLDDSSGLRVPRQGIIIAPIISAWRAWAIPSFSVERRTEIQGPRRGVGRGAGQGLRRASLPPAERRIPPRVGLHRPGQDGAVRVRAGPGSQRRLRSCRAGSPGTSSRWRGRSKEASGE